MIFQGGVEYVNTNIIGSQKSEVSIELIEVVKVTDEKKIPALGEKYTDIHFLGYLLILSVLFIVIERRKHVKK